MDKGILCGTTSDSIEEQKESNIIIGDLEVAENNQQNPDNYEDDYYLRIERNIIDLLSSNNDSKEQNKVDYHSTINALYNKNKILHTQPFFKSEHLNIKRTYLNSLEKDKNYVDHEIREDYSSHSNEKADPFASETPQPKRKLSSSLKDCWKLNVNSTKNNLKRRIQSTNNIVKEVL